MQNILSPLTNPTTPLPERNAATLFCPTPEEGDLLDLPQYIKQTVGSQPERLLLNFLLVK